MSQSVWCVWTEWGDYENYSRDLRGTFTTRELANAHAAQLIAVRSYDVCEVVEERVLSEVPENVPYIIWSARIAPDGSEDNRLGFNRREAYRTWSNQIEPAKGRLSKWNGLKSPKRDLYIEVIGSDPVAVETEYNRLLVMARAQLSASGV
jgi:hypothetical protein